MSPTSGTASTQFTFSTVYFGQNKATACDVVIDGTAHPLTFQSGSPATGALYSATMTLPAGTHSFAFYVTDGTNYWGDPPNDGIYTGLVVTAAKQALVHSRDQGAAAGPGAERVRRGVTRIAPWRAGTARQGSPTGHRARAA